MLPPIFHKTEAVAAAIFVINLPFGYWRAGVKRFSLPWFLAVHIPVPMAVGLRFSVGLGLRAATLPIFVGAFFTGQFLGGKLRGVKENTENKEGIKKSDKGQA